MAAAPNNDKEVWILKHVANEGAGTIHDFLLNQKIPIRFIELYRGEAIPQDLSNLRAVCVMGGPMNVDDEAKHPFLNSEKAFIRRLIDKEIPCLGVCLGSQLIASALEKRVYKAPVPEIGWSEVRLTPEAGQDPVFGALGSKLEKLEVLQWHEDTFDLPDGAVLLAKGHAVPHQAFRVGRFAYGLQFHIEVNGAMLLDWFEKRPDCTAILSHYRAYQAHLNILTHRFYTAFFNL
jgi:GMP synthase-like glutamine amidotransferase